MIKVLYRGFEIEVRREAAMGGWENLYFSVVRQDDGRIMTDSFTEGSDDEHDFLAYIKKRVNRWCDHPELFESEDDF